MMSCHPQVCVTEGPVSWQTTIGSLARCSKRSWADVWTASAMPSRSVLIEFRDDP